MYIENCTNVRVGTGWALIETHAFWVLVFHCDIRHCTGSFLIKLFLL